MSMYLVSVAVGVMLLSAKTPTENQEALRNDHQCKERV